MSQYDYKCTVSRAGNGEPPRAITFHVAANGMANAFANTMEIWVKAFGDVAPYEVNIENKGIISVGG